MTPDIKQLRRDLGLTGSARPTIAPTPSQPATPAVRQDAGPEPVAETDTDTAGAVVAWLVGLALLAVVIWIFADPLLALLAFLWKMLKFLFWACVVIAILAGIGSSTSD